MAIEDSKRIFAEHARTSMQDATEHDLSNVLFDGFENANTVLKNASFHFEEVVLTTMATKWTSDGMFKQNLEWWKQSSL